MPVQDEQIKYIISTYPSASGDNTEFCLRFWEEALKQKGFEMPDYVKAVILAYKPEAITRKRREIIESTKGQREEEYKYWKEYKHN
jgi:hypothetical protein